MTVIRPNSVSGITSITAQANEINVFRSNGLIAGLNLNGVNFNTTAGISTLAALKVTGNLDVEGVLTYQDVTNVDSLGIGTFRTGINVSGGQLDVGSNIKLGNAGVITATSFVGSGAQLTGITQTTINNNTNNYVVTATGTANTLNGESNLTFDGNTLFVDDSILTVQKTGAGSGASKLQLQPYGTDGYINCTASGNLYTRMGTGFTTRTQIDSNGNFTVSSGNLVIGTAGKGIDFSATSDATHTAVTSGAQPSTDSEVLTDYEHGTWTPRLRAYDHAGGAGWNTMKYTDGTEVTGTGRYVRMGNHVWAGFKFESGSKVFDSSWTYWSIDNTPYGANHYDKASGSLYVSQTNFFTDSNSHIGGFVHGNESYMVVNKPNGHSNATINTSNNNRYCYGHISIYTSRT